MVRVDADHVDIRLVRPIRADEADQEPHEMSVVVRADPRGPVEMLEPGPRQQLVEWAAAPPIVDAANEHAMIGLHGASEADPGRRGHRLGHRATTQARPTASTISIGTMMPNT